MDGGNEFVLMADLGLDKVSSFHPSPHNGDFIILTQNDNILYGKAGKW